jgi:RimJ/RimL family protein N-acetyltransferase/acyl carrier protein
MTSPQPSLRSPHLMLRIVTPGDYPFLYHLAIGTPDSYRWRFRGSQPSFEEFVQTHLRQGIFCHFVVESDKLKRPVGYAACYAADMRSRRAYIAIQGAPELANRGLLIDAGRMLIDYLFSEFEFNKLYAECPGFVFESFRSGLGSPFVEEGRLHNHERFRDQWWDLHILALYRNDWPPVSQFGSQFTMALQANDYGQGATFDEFAIALKGEFNLEAYGLAESTLFTADLGFDSIQIYELICLIEEIGEPVNDAAVENMATVGDAYGIYLQSVTSRQS